jgi:2-dehydropantoate 2-reductase
MLGAWSSSCVAGSPGTGGARCGPIPLYCMEMRNARAKRLIGSGNRTALAGDALGTWVFRNAVLVFRRAQRYNGRMRNPWGGIMRLLVVGAGSTGGFFGGRLAQAGRDVTFLVRPNRAAQLREKGLEIVSPHGNALVRPKIATAKELRDTFDAVLLTVKAFSLEAALDDFAPAVGPDTCILPVLNGMRHMDILAARFGQGAVAGCAAKVATTLDDAGRIIQLAPFHDIAYGEMDGTKSARIADLDAFMQGAGFDARLSANIALEIWEKWAMLATLGGTTCLMRGNIGEIAGASGGAQFLLRFFNEVVSIINVVGVPVSEACISLMKSAFAAEGSTLTSSMYRDLQANHPVEAEQIIGDLLSRGRSAGIAAPLLEAAYTHLAVYQDRIQPRRG